MTAHGFTAFAELLVANAFTVTFARGKAPIVPRWQNPQPTNAAWLQKVLRSSRYRECNVGIVCGRVVAIDIDNETAPESARLKRLADELLGPPRFERIGRAPRTLLLYRPAKSEFIASCRVGSVDVLAGGKQFIAYGIHPDIQQPYRWTDSRFNPATAKIDEVPVITAAALVSFLEAIGCAGSAAPIAVMTPCIVDRALKSRQRARQGEIFGSRYDCRIIRDGAGRVTDGREALMAKLIAAEFAKGTHRSPDDLAHRVWSRFIAEADVSRPKGSNPRQARASRRSQSSMSTYMRAVRQSSVMSRPRGVGSHRKRRNNPMHLPMHLAPLCLARTRRGSPCQSPAMTNGRCRMHGGTSPGAPKGNKNAWKHGRYSAETIARRRSIAELIRLARQFIDA